MRICFMPICLTALLAIAGCGVQGYPTVRLEGCVRVNGHPIEQGNITFTPLQSDQGASVAARIESGNYVVVKAPRGKVRVDFHAVKETGKTIMQYGKPYPETVNVIPEKYRAGLEIAIDGDNLHKDFSL